jgi:hypothetical protein
MARQYVKNGGLGQIDLVPMLERIGQTVTDELRVGLAAVGLPDDGSVRIQKAVVSRTVGETVEVLMPQYYIWIENGRRPGGKFPPAAAVLEWMKRKGIARGEENKVLYVIRRAIAQKGIKPRPFVLGAIDRAGVSRIPQIFSTFAEEFSDEYLNSLVQPK